VACPSPAADEQLLWQGSARLARMLARNAFHVRKLTVYFAPCWPARLSSCWPTAVRRSSRARLTVAAAAAGRLALGLVALLAWLSARTTVYTLTDKRVVMRIGIVLT
jgi:hypothetical protein